MNKRALVVEDDSNIAELLRLYLSKDGFEVMIAADGGKAESSFDLFQPDVVHRPQEDIKTGNPVMHHHLPAAAGSGGLRVIFPGQHSHRQRHGADGTENHRPRRNCR